MKGWGGAIAASNHSLKYQADHHCFWQRKYLSNGTIGKGYDTN